MFLTKRPNGYYYLVEGERPNKRFITTGTRRKSEALKFFKAYKGEKNNNRKASAKVRVSTSGGWSH